MIHGNLRALRKQKKAGLTKGLWSPPSFPNKALLIEAWVAWGGEVGKLGPLDSHERFERWAGVGPTATGMSSAYVGGTKNLMLKPFQVTGGNDGLYVVCLFKCMSYPWVGVASCSEFCFYLIANSVDRRIFYSVCFVCFWKVLLRWHVRLL